MARDDRFQEESEFSGARCASCDAPITDENSEAEVIEWRRDDLKYSTRTFDGCEHERKIQAMKNAVLFLNAEIAEHQADYDDHGSPEDALGELCEAFGFEFHHAGTVEKLRTQLQRSLIGRAA